MTYRFLSVCFSKSVQLSLSIPEAFPPCLTFWYAFTTHSSGNCRIRNLPTPLRGCLFWTLLNNLSPSLLSVFTEYLHSYGLARLPFHAFFSRCPKTDIPCSVIKPNFKSCRLYNGGRIASKQVSAMPVSTSFAQCDFARQLLWFRYFFSDSFSFISWRLTWFILWTFSLSVHHSSLTTFAAQSGLITPPVRRYRYFVLFSTFQDCIIFITACQRAFL